MDTALIRLVNCTQNIKKSEMYIIFKFKSSVLGDVYSFNKNNRAKYLVSIQYCIMWFIQTFDI